MSYEFKGARTKPTGDVSTGALMIIVIAAAQVAWLGPLIWMLLQSL